MSDSRDEIAQIRAALEHADGDLVAALDARARAVRGFIALRERDPQGYHGLPSAAEVLARVRELRKDFPEAGLEPVIREVLGVCSEMVAPVHVAVLAPEGGFTHLAARRWFGSRAVFHASATVADVFSEVEKGRAAHAVVPFETSSEGANSATLHALTETRAKVIGEITLASSWHLWSRTGNVGDVEKVYGAASSLAACERTLHQDLPKAPLLDVRSGVVAAQLALEDHGAAALGSEVLGEIAPELRIVRRNLEDEIGVQTRFVVLGQQQPRRSGTDRTMIVLSLSGEPGSLYAALQPFAERGINLTRLESRPARGSVWHDLFFVELEGHVSDRPVLTAIDEVKVRARHLKVVGSYPRPSEPHG